MRRCRAALWIAVASFVLAIAACSSSSPSATAGATSASASPTAATRSPRPLSIDDFVSQADAICTSAITAGAAVPTPSASKGDVNIPAVGDLPVIATYFASLITVFQSQMTQLQELGTPLSNQSEWSASLAAFQTIVNDFKIALRAAQADDVFTYDAVITQVGGGGQPAGRAGLLRAREA